MLVHGRDELVALAQRCAVLPETSSSDWDVDAWHMTDDDVQAAIAAYEALLLGGATDEVVSLLLAANVPLTQLLLDEEHSKDDITRSDLTELTAAASLIADPACDPEHMYMPNVPKMSRRKSDSGIDIFEVRLNRTQETGDLEDEEYLRVASVKHTTDTSAQGLRWKLAESLSGDELTQTYLASQLRVVHGQLVREGFTRNSASRVYLFLRDFGTSGFVDVYAVGVVEPGLEEDLRHHVDLLPEDGAANATFRMIFMPELNEIHTRCP